MKNEIIISKTNIHSIRNSLILDSVANLIKGTDYIDVNVPKSITEEACIKLYDTNKTFKKENTLSLLAEGIKSVVKEDKLDWDATNPNVVISLSSSFITCTVQDCVALYNSLLNKKQKLTLNKYQEVIRDTFTKWYVRLFNDFYNVFEGKAILKLTKRKNNYNIWVCPSEKMQNRIKNSKKLLKIWNENALDMLMNINVRGNKAVIARTVTIDLNNSTFEYLMSIPGFFNYINDYLTVF